ncbi:MAG TPA: hypothetical protein ENH85_05110 [Candidatus Scalindua sp.]|nr:hypothetical protein [Candidatus Scalindua sp.]
MFITPKHINEIAQELKVGMKVYVNKETSEIKPFLDVDDLGGITGFWEKDIEEIENTWCDYIIISKMESWEEYKVMEAFIDEVEDEALQEKLRNVLVRKSPFGHFKSIVGRSSFRQNWFDFQLQEYETYIKNQLELGGFIIKL